MGGSKASFFVLDIILLFVFVNFILMLFNIKGIPFVAGFFIVMTLLFLAFVALMGVYNHHNWGFVLLGFIFVLMLISPLLLYYMNIEFTRRFIMTVLLSALGFVISIAGIKRKERVVEEVEEEVTKDFEPGKYVASKTGTTYHAPTCEWAKKIKERNRVWLDSDKEAKKEGYKKHSCLK